MTAPLPPPSMRFADRDYFSEPLLKLAVREALERAANEAEHWQKISTTPGHACGQYIAQVIRAMI